MKTFNVFTTLLFCVFFVNISAAQTLMKKQQTNKERLTNKTRTESNIKSTDSSKDEQKDITSPKKNYEKPKQLELNRRSSKVKMISSTTIVPNTTKEKNIRIKAGKLNDQQLEIQTKKVEDE
tara:strand:+ start:102 stop:467 length:366 start_codon:yes stop_codon:yes gene_type:complete